MNGRVVGVARDGEHRFSKKRVASIAILAGLGVEGDAHQGNTVKHRSRVAVDPTQPNLRQVHLIHAELFGALAAKGFEVGPADLGENITTEGVDLLGLSRNGPIDWHGSSVGSDGPQKSVCADRAVSARPPRRRYRPRPAGRADSQGWHHDRRT